MIIGKIEGRREAGRKEIKAPAKKNKQVEMKKTKKCVETGQCFQILEDQNNYKEGNVYTDLPNLIQSYLSTSISTSDAHHSLMWITFLGPGHTFIILRKNDRSYTW